MITVNTKAQVDKEGNATVRVPNDIAPGEYRIVMVIDALPQSVQKTMYPLTFTDHNFPSPNGDTFRREDIYSDDGR